MLVRFGEAGDTDNIVGDKLGRSAFLLQGPLDICKLLTAGAFRRSCTGRTST